LATRSTVLSTPHSRDLLQEKTLKAHARRQST